MRLIDADKLYIPPEEMNAKMAVAYAPTIDAVQVVRCRDCKWWKTNYSWSTGEYKVCVREAYEPLRNGEDFCSYGERSIKDETN